MREQYALADAFQKTATQYRDRTLDPLLNNVNKALSELVAEDYDSAQEMVRRVDAVNTAVASFPEAVVAQFSMDAPDLKEGSNELAGKATQNAIDRVTSLTTSDYATETQKAATRRLHAAAQRLKNALDEQAMKQHVYTPEAAQQGLASAQ